MQTEPKFISMRMKAHHKRTLVTKKIQMTSMNLIQIIFSHPDFIIQAISLMSQYMKTQKSPQSLNKAPHSKEWLSKAVLRKMICHLF